MNGWPTVGVAGARGVVGGVFCSILVDAGLPAECLRAFGHEASNTIAYRVARLEQLAKWDLGDPDLRFTLALAARLVQDAQD